MSSALFERSSDDAFKVLKFSRENPLEVQSVISVTSRGHEMKEINDVVNLMSY